MLRLMRGLFSHPIVAETTKFGLLFTGAEITQQAVVKRFVPDLGGATEPSTALAKGAEALRGHRSPLDWGSVFRYAVWGFAIFPHVLRRWYRLLDSAFRAPGWRTVTVKTVVDQAVFPVPILASFYVFLSLLEGKTDSWESLTAECRAKLFTTLKARYCFMVPAQFINFALVPPKHRVIYVGCTTFLWLNVLCVLKRLDSSNPIFS